MRENTFFDRFNLLRPSARIENLIKNYHLEEDQKKIGKKKFSEN